MNNAKLLYFVGVGIIWTLTAVTALVNGLECQDLPYGVPQGGFLVRSERTDRLHLYIICQDGHDWANFTDVKVNCSSVGRTDLINCTLSPSVSLLDTFHMMNVNYSAEIKLKNLRSPPSRQYFRGISTVELSIKKSNLDQLPYDMLYDVLDLTTLTIHHTDLLRIPVGFFKVWSRNLTRLDIMDNKLRKIAKGDLTDLLELRHLQLNGNEIAEIEAGAFDNLSNLQSLDIGNNRLHTLPSGIFRHLAGLTTLHMGQNPFAELPADLLTSIENSHLNEFHMVSVRGSLKTMPAGFFKNLVSLKQITLQDNQLESLPSDLFADTSEPVDLNLRDNALTTLPADLFKSFNNLKTLDLARNQISTLPDGIFEPLVNLASLDISYNNWTTLNAGVLRGLNVLENLTASHNHLNKVNEDFCSSVKSVTKIDFSFNQLSFQATRNYLNIGSTSIFVSCAHLKEIDLSNNKATRIFSDYFHTKFIDLSNNHLSQFTVQDIEYLNPVGIVDLRNNRISKINLTELPSAMARYNAKNKVTRSLKVMLGSNPLHCDCHLIDFVNYWKSEHNSEFRQYVKLIAGDDHDDMVCASPVQFRNRQISSIDPRDLSCPLKTEVAGDACNNTCACREYPANQLLTLDCSHGNLTQLPAMLANARNNWSIALNMSNNLLKQTPSLATNPYLANVTHLDLSSNNISSVTIDLFSENLVELQLHNNSISRLDEQVVKSLERRKNTMSLITLHENPWQCDCQALKFLTFVQDSHSIGWREKVRCHGTNKKLSEMTVRKVCKDAIAVIVTASLLVAFFGIGLGILAALYYKYQQEIKVWLYSKQWCLWFVTEDELDKDKKYDAFVSFSHKDEDFVEKEIVAKLEDGPRPYKLCLHYRDWLAGEWIPVQISQSVEESRRTIVILSPNFLESVWGRMEFRAAHTQALKEGRTRVIIILYGAIENMDDLDPELKAYLSLNTYIKWGDPWFWDKLRYALPHRSEPSRRRARNARTIEDHLIRQTANSDAGNAVVKSDVISMSKLANDSAKLLDPSLDDRIIATC